MTSNKKYILKINKNKILKINNSLFIFFLFFINFPHASSSSFILRRSPKSERRLSPAVGYFPRRLADVNNKQMIERVPLYGSINDYAYYFLNVKVGSPPQTQSVILDTGSSLLGFSCQSCTSCGKHIDPPFDISSSSTAQRYSCLNSTCVSRERCSARSLVNDIDTCLYSQVYSEGSSIKGFYFSDLISLETTDKEFQNPTVRYDYLGCHQKETVLFVTQKANGILGISFPKGGTQPTAMDTLFRSNFVNSKVFALCVAEEGGLLTVGGYETSYHRPSSSRAGNQLSGLEWLSESLFGKSRQINNDNNNNSVSNSAVVWTDILSESAYSVAVSSIQLNGQIVSTGPFGEVLVDSGTTYSYFPPAVFTALAKTLTVLCSADSRCQRGQSDLVCWNLEKPEEELEQIPSLHVTFGGGGIMEWKARSYLFRKSPTVWCSAVENNRRMQTILGMSFMKNSNMIVDRENDQIGFAVAECPSHTRFESANAPAGENSASLTNADAAGSSPQVAENAEPAKESTNETIWVMAGGAGVIVLCGLGAAIFTSVRARRNYNPLGSDGVNIDEFGNIEGLADEVLHSRRESDLGLDDPMHSSALGEKSENKFPSSTEESEDDDDESIVADSKRPQATLREE